MINTETHGQGIPEVFAGARRGFTFRNQVTEREAARQSTDVRGVIHVEENSKNRDVEHPFPELAAVFLPQMSMMEACADQDSNQSHDGAGRSH